MFQIWVQTPRRYRMDGLLVVRNPQFTCFNLEVDGLGHDPARDRRRAEAIGLPTLRIPNHEVLTGPTLTQRLRALGYCLPRE